MLKFKEFFILNIIIIGFMESSSTSLLTNEYGLNITLLKKILTQVTFCLV